MTYEPLSEGGIVRSRAGRDRGRTFVVRKVLDADYVLLVDGTLRTLEHPKKKKRKHLKLVREPLAGIAERLSQGNTENHEIRKWLSDKEE